MFDIKKIEKLDNVFLFGLKSVGLIISFIGIKEGLIGFIELFPFIFLGILMPLYVGYLRGAIELNSIVERIRGWIYFLVGISSYFGFYVTKPENILSRYYALIISIPFGFLTYKFIKWIYKNLNLKIHISHIFSYSGTFICVILVSFFFNLFKGIIMDLSNMTIDVIYDNLAFFIFFIDIELAMFLIILIFEIAARDILKDTLKLDEDYWNEENVKFDRFGNIKILFKIVSYGLLLFEFSFFYKFSKIFWIMSYIIWIVGSLLINFNINFISCFYLLISTLLIFIGLFYFLKTESIPYENMKYSNSQTSLIIAFLTYVVIIYVIFDFNPIDAFIYLSKFFKI